MANRKPLTALLKDLIQQITLLLRLELRLAQAELTEKAAQAQTGLVFIVAGLIALSCGVLFLLAGGVLLLSQVIPLWSAAVALGGMLALLAYGLIQRGLRGVKLVALKPERTLKSLQTGKQKATDNWP
ncbi:MAG: phage holin family protein [Magnetospiraceae bacterium]